MANYSSLFTGAPDKKPDAPEPVAKRQPYRLLLVDDEPNVLKALMRVFRQENYQVVIAVNGQEALKLLEKS